MICDPAKRQRIPANAAASAIRNAITAGARSMASMVNGHSMKRGSAGLRIPNCLRVKSEPVNQQPSDAASWDRVTILPFRNRIHGAPNGRSKLAQSHFACDPSSPHRCDQRARATVAMECRHMVMATSQIPVFREMRCSIRQEQVPNIAPGLARGPSVYPGLSFRNAVQP